MLKDVRKLVIIGSGPAGLTAAIYAARDDLEPLIISGRMPGGQLTITTDVDDFPGFPEGIQGPELIRRFRLQAERFGTKFLEEDVIKVVFKKPPFRIQTESSEVLAESVILAMGASPRFLNLPNEKRLVGRGVSVCAVCDGAFFKGKKVAVVGGGDTAMREAQHLSRLASEVVVVHRRNEFRAKEALVKVVESKPNVKFLMNKETVDILGKERVEAIKVKDNKSAEVETIEINGIFLAIGHEPNTKFLNKQIKLDENGYITVHQETKTSIHGIFVAGDVADHRYRQAVTAAGSGAKAALDVSEYLHN